MRKKLTLKEINEKLIDLNSDLECLEYNGSSDISLFKCKKCGSLYEKRFSNKERLHCKDCYMKKRDEELKKIHKTILTEEFYEKGLDRDFELLDIYRTKEIKNNYYTTTIRIKCICKKCGNEIDTPINSFLYEKYKCKTCFFNDSSNLNKKRITNEEFLSRVKKLYNDEISILSNFITVNDPIKIRCNKCGNIEVIDAKRIMYDYNYRFKCQNCSSGLNNKERDNIKTYKEKKNIL